MLVGKPVTTLQRNKNMFDFVKVVLNLDIKFFITVEPLL